MGCFADRECRSGWPRPNISLDELRDFFPEIRSRIEDMFGRCWQCSPIACYDPSLQLQWSPSGVTDENLEWTHGPMKKLFEELLPHEIVDAGQNLQISNRRFGVKCHQGAGNWAA